MAAGVAVPWDTCAEADCLGARSGVDGRCLAHAGLEALILPLASSGQGVDLDGRGVRFTQESIERVLERCPRDEAGRRLLGTVRLDQATFEGNVSFDEVIFSGDVAMPGATFVGAARFGGAAFAAAADFGEATFESQAWFVGASFGGPASFRAAKLLGPVWFQQATFRSHAIFDGAAFVGDATLSGVRFAGVASFWGASFDRHARFDASSSAGGWRFEGARFAMEDEGPGVAAPPPVDGPITSVEGRSPSERPRPTYEAPRGFGWRIPLVVAGVVAVVAFIVLRPTGRSSSTFNQDPDQEEGRSGFGFLHKDPAGDEATRYDPCQPIRYVVNPVLAPPGWEESLREALDEVSRVSGLRFESAGTTTERVRPDLPTDMNRVYGWPRDVKGYTKAYQDLFDRASYQPDRYGKGRWAPVLISWESFSDLGPTTDGFLGVGASEIRDGRDGTVYVSGTLVMNADAENLWLLPPTLMHELGHVVGLAHVSDPEQLMFPSNTGRGRWGSGDIQGLRRVGLEAGCVAVPAPKS